MAKTNGLNVRLYTAGYDLSGDANALSGMGYTNELLDVTTLDVSARKRIVGTVDSEISVEAFFDNAASQQHAVWTSNSNKLPTADQVVLIPLGSTAGDGGVGLVSKQGTYNIARGPGSAITASTTYTANGSGSEFGVMLTALDDTYSSASSGTSIDNSASSSSGGAAYVQVFSLASGTVAMKVEHSANNSSWSDLVAFTNATGITSERVTVSGTVNRYIRFTTTGTFSNANVAVLFSRS